MASRPSLALIGAGLFARDAYLPILKDLSDVLRLSHVWSRSQASAEQVEELVRDISPPPLCLWGEEGLLTILASPDVQCCAVVLPIQVQPDIVVRILRAGKHVLQEKPVGATVREAVETFRIRASLEVPPIWAVGENFRFEPAMQEARSVCLSLGAMSSFNVDVEVPLTASNKYFACQWRRESSLPGGFITDCGVHFVAALRMITGQEVVSLCSLCTHRDPSLPPPDTLSATMLLANGCAGTMLVSYSSCANKMVWRVVCRDGAVEVERGKFGDVFGFQVSKIPRQGAAERRVYPLSGLEDELRAFALNVVEEAAIPDWRSSPEEALRDLCVVETAVSAGVANKGQVQVEKIAF